MIWTALVLAAAAPTAPFPLTAADKAVVVKSVKDQLLDGEAARWRWPLHQPKFGLYCAWVNSKNRLGAYTGWAPYMVTGGKSASGKFLVLSVDVANSDLSGDDSEIVVTMCSRHGYDLTNGPPPE